MSVLASRVSRVIAGGRMCRRLGVSSRSARTSAVRVAIGTRGSTNAAVVECFSLSHTQNHSSPLCAAAPRR